VAARRAEGCLTVEMEAAALFAVAQYRGITIGQLLYAGDDLSGDEWDHRGWDKDRAVRERLFDLALDAVQRL
jgi:uridine phosphorylase